MNRGFASDFIARSAIPGPQKLVLIAYLSHQHSADDPREATSWPSVELICCFTSNGVKTTAKHKARLIESGVLEVVRKRPGNVDECRINFEVLDALGRAKRGQAVAPGRRGGRFGKDCRTALAKTALPQRLRLRKDCRTALAKTAEPLWQRLPLNLPQEPSSRTLLRESARTSPRVLPSRRSRVRLLARRPRPRPPGVASTWRRSGRTWSLRSRPGPRCSPTPPPAG